MYSAALQRMSNLVGLSSPPRQEASKSNTAASHPAATRDYPKVVDDRHSPSRSVPGDSQKPKDRVGGPLEIHERPATRARSHTSAAIEDPVRRDNKDQTRSATEQRPESPVKIGSNQPSQHRIDSSNQVTVLREKILEEQDKNRGLEATVTKLRAELQLARAATARDEALANLASTGDVVRKLDNLHAEIFQIAAMLSDSEAHPRPTTISRTAIFEKYGQYLFHLVGPDLSQYLANIEPCKVPDVVVQMVLQAAMVAWCAPILDSWSSGVVGDFDRMFDALFSEVRSNEELGNTSRWRAMTRKHAQTIFAPKEYDFGRILLSHVTTVLQFTNEKVTIDTVNSIAGERLSAVVAATLDLNQVMGAQMVSDDLQVMRASVGEGFNPTAMSSMWEDGKKTHGGRPVADVVMFTTSLGIAKVTVRRTDDRAIHALLVKPKVLLRSDLTALLQ
ncbi:hypothetical protein C8F01DRAFT_1294100 [Mycena amicta]|nr:hypothetical protein C8F01DRAFT_1294100 [Mycena amicta]